MYKIEVEYLRKMFFGDKIPVIYSVTMRTSLISIWLKLDYSDGAYYWQIRFLSG